MSNLEHDILKILSKNDIEYKVYEHRAVYTCADMASALNVRESSVLKSLVLTTDEGDVFVLIIPGDKKFVHDRVARLVRTKQLHFVNPREVKELIGCEVGCIPPFGHLNPLKVYLSRDVIRKKRVFFNPGIHTKTIEIEPKCLVKLCDPVLI